MNRALKLFLPVVVIVLGVLAAGTMIKNRPVVETRPPEVPVPLVRVLPVEYRNVQHRVRSQGTVMPRTESALIPEVSGTLVWVSGSLAPGSFFEANEVLLKIDTREYDLARVGARSAVAQQELRLAREKQEADVARQEWETLGRGTPTALALRQPQLAEAEAALASAQAALEKAELDLERTKIHSPYAGRVRTKSVDVGQFVNRGTSIALIYAVDFAEVRLPIPDELAAFLNLPLSYRGEKVRQSGPEVLLHARFAGKEHTWRGRIVRTEGEIDAKSRMIHAIAQVRNPYGRGQYADRPPLAVGMFVEAEILGKKASNIAVLPRTALRSEDTVLVVDPQQRLRFRKVDILRKDQEQVLLSRGLGEGERVCISPLDVPVEGMKVRVAAQNPPEPPKGPS